MDISFRFLLTIVQRNDRPPPPPVLELKELKEEVPPPETLPPVQRFSDGRHQEPVLDENSQYLNLRIQTESTSEEIIIKTTKAATLEALDDVPCESMCHVFGIGSSS